MAICFAILITMSGYPFAVGSIWVTPITEMMAEPAEGEEALDDDETLEEE
jgi:hypothetical protein